MSKSIINDSGDRCWACGNRATLQCHHIMNGYPNRKHSEHYGLKVKRIAEKKFIEKYSFEKWMSTFHKNYLEEDEINEK